MREGLSHAARGYDQWRGVAPDDEPPRTVGVPLPLGVEHGVARGVPPGVPLGVRLGVRPGVCRRAAT